MDHYSSCYYINIIPLGDFTTKMTYHNMEKCYVFCNLEKTYKLSNPWNFSSIDHILINHFKYFQNSKSKKQIYINIIIRPQLVSSISPLSKKNASKENKN